MFETKGSDPQDAHIKIQVNAKEDIQYLQQELREHARKTLDEKRDQIIMLIQQRTAENQKVFAKANPNYKPAPIPTAEVLNRALDIRFEQWLARVWKTAGKSIEINGQPYLQGMTAVQEMEPIDYELQNTLQDKQREYNEELEHVTKLRRRAPQSIDALMTDLIDQSTKHAVLYHPPPISLAADPQPSVLVDQEVPDDTLQRYQQAYSSIKFAAIE